MRTHTRLFFLVGRIRITIVNVVINVKMSLVLGTYYCREEMLKMLLELLLLWFIWFMFLIVTSIRIKTTSVTTFIIIIVSIIVIIILLLLVSCAALINLLFLSVSRG